MIFMLGKLFDQLIGKTVDSVTRAAEAKFKRETIGKAEGKMLQAESTMRQRAIRGVDKSIDGAMGKKKK